MNGNQMLIRCFFKSPRILIVDPRGSGTAKTTIVKDYLAEVRRPAVGNILGETVTGLLGLQFTFNVSMYIYIARTIGALAHGGSSAARPVLR